MKCSLPTLIILLVVSASLYSCQKEEGKKENKLAADSTKLKFMVSFDTTKPSGSDTLATYSFMYDDKQRLTKLTRISYPLGPFEVLEFHLFYTGNDTLPSMFVKKFWPQYTQHTQPPSSSDTSYFFYSGGKVYKDSMVPQHSTFASVSEFRQMGSGNIQHVVKSISRYTPVFYITDSVNITSIYSGNNLTERRDTTNFFGNLAARRYNYTYDTYQNPLNRFAIRYPVYYPNGPIFRSLVPLYLREISGSNIISFNRYHNNNLAETVNYGQTYYPSGLLRSHKMIAPGFAEVSRYFYGL